MALIKCSECGKEFSDKASACPNCACPNEIKKQVSKEFAELSKEERKELKNYMFKKGVLYSPTYLILTFLGFAFAILGLFVHIIFLLFYVCCVVATIGIHNNYVKQYYYNNPNCIETNK